jgi:TolA-binding protein
LTPHPPSRFRRFAILLAAVLLGASSCAPAVVVKRRDAEIKSIETVGVLLFDRVGEGGTRKEAEVMTEVFSLQMRRYFPVLVERFEIEAELAKRGEAVPTRLTAQRARELGALFDCDGFFTGEVTLLKETRPTLFGLRGANQFALSVTLVSGRSGEVLLTSTVEEEGSFLLPLDTSREISIHAVRQMVKKFGFDEERGRWLTRDSALWRRAMQAYEERRFWDAAQAFGEAITQYPVSSLTEESYLLLGRCFYELGLPRGAERAWSSLAALFPKSRFRPAALGEMASLAYREGRAAAGDSLASALRTAYKKGSAIDPALYAAAMAAKDAGRCEQALARLALIPPESDYASAARYARAECLAAAGREDDAASELRAAAAGAPRSRSDATLAAEAWVAIGRRRLLAGDDSAALDAFARVDPRDDLRDAAAIGRAWAHLRRADAAAAMADLADGSRWSGSSRLEGALLRAVAQKELGDLAGATASLGAARAAAAALRSAPTSGTLRERAATLRDALRGLETSAWEITMRRPTAERGEDAARLGAKLLPLGSDLAGAVRGAAEARRAEIDAPRIAVAEERAELLAASIALVRERAAKAKAPRKTERPLGEGDASAVDAGGAAIGSGARAAGADASDAGTNGDVAAALPPEPLRASGSGRLLRRDGTEMSGRVVSLALSDVGFQPSGADSVRLVPRAEVHRVLYDDGTDVFVGKLHKDDKSAGLREAYVREISMKPYLLETELQISRRQVAERSMIRGLIVGGVTTMFVEGRAKLIVFPAVFAGQFALAYFTGL